MCVPIGSAPARPARRGSRQWCGVHTEGLEHRGDVVGVVGSDEHVDVDVDGGAGFGVVRESERAAERVRDAAVLQRNVERDDFVGERWFLHCRRRGTGNRSASSNRSRSASPRSSGVAPLQAAAARTESETSTSGSTASESAAASAGDGR